MSSDLSPSKPELSPPAPPGDGDGVTITPAMVTEALRGCRYPHTRNNGLSLLRTEVVGRYLRQNHHDDTADTRWRALEAVLAALVLRMRSRPRVFGSPDIPGQPVAGAFPKPHATDAVETLSIDKQSVEAVFLWCFAEPRETHRSIGKLLRLRKRTTERRIERGTALLAAQLQEVEREAQHALQVGPMSKSAPLKVAEAASRYGTPRGETGFESQRAHIALALVRDAVMDQRDLPDLTPGELTDVANIVPQTVNEYLLRRIVAWLQRGPFERRFVKLSLWRDTTGEPGVTPATEVDRVFDSLEEALSELDARLIVLVGGPGSGKSTLLEHLEWESACTALRGDSNTIPILVRLSQLPQHPVSDDDFLLNWLRREWLARSAALPTLDNVMAAGRLLLLLDGLNELPHRNLPEYGAYVRQWRSCAHAIRATHPDNRVIFSCRTLDYTTPLSSLAAPVPRLQIKPLDDDPLRQYLQMHVPGDSNALWSRIEAANLINVLRVPYYLRLFADVLSVGNEFPTGRAGLFATFIRSRLRSEIDRGNPRFDPDHLITRNDYLRLARGRSWPRECELPENGSLIPGLDTLALHLHMIGREEKTDGASLARSQATEVLAQPHAGDIIEAGETLGLLVDLADDGTLAFAHQQLQAFFVARTLAASPQPERVAREWRAGHVDPALDDVLTQLHPAEPLPSLQQTGWEEPTMLAVELAPQADGYVAAIADANLALAGRCAAIPAIGRRLTRQRLDDIRHALVARSRNAEADLRDRIECALALGELGDPRFSLHTDPKGAYLLPPMIAIAGGTVIIGDRDPRVSAVGVTDGHTPLHEIDVEPFEIGQFPVTNAEWAQFIAAGGYEAVHWWDTVDGRAWQAGTITGATQREDAKSTARYFRTHPEELDKHLHNGAMDRQWYDAWQVRLQWSDEEEEERLRARFPDGPVRQPELWTYMRYNHPAQPVVGITWYEARAYCRWLSARSGRRFRLPTEVEWEAATRGNRGRRFPYGDHFLTLAGNTNDLHIRRPTPIGVFPDGDTPEGVTDLSGNVLEWTSSAWGADDAAATYPYPYCGTDGREDAELPYTVRRVTRGGSTLNDAVCALAFIRGITLPGLRSPVNGMRLVASASR